jgi:hypothetical protein
MNHQLRGPHFPTSVIGGNDAGHEGARDRVPNAGGVPTLSGRLRDKPASTNVPPGVCSIHRGHPCPGMAGTCPDKFDRDGQGTTKERFANRPCAIAPSYALAGDMPKATEVYKNFLSSWQNADSNLTQMKTAKSWLATHKL